MASKRASPKTNTAPKVEPSNTSAPASTETAADVLNSAPVTAGVESSSSAAATAETPKAEGTETSPVGGEAKVDESSSSAADQVGADLLAVGQSFTHEIKAVEQRGICRAGVRWYHEPRLVNRADWTDEQWAALTGERLLIVREL